MSDAQTVHDATRISAEESPDASQTILEVDIANAMASVQILLPRDNPSTASLPEPTAALDGEIRLMWNKMKVGGPLLESKGLTNRRSEERQLFEKGSYSE
jgi:hypothetical protein